MGRIGCSPTPRFGKMKGERAKDDQRRESGDEGQRAKRARSAQRGRGVARSKRAKDLIDGFLIEAAPDDDKPVPTVPVRPFRELHRRMNDVMGGVNCRWSV